MSSQLTNAITNVYATTVRWRWILLLQFFLYTYLFCLDFFLEFTLCCQHSFHNVFIYTKCENLCIRTGAYNLEVCLVNCQIENSFLPLFHFCCFVFGCACYQACFFLCTLAMCKYSHCWMITTSGLNEWLLYHRNVSARLVARAQTTRSNNKTICTTIFWYKTKTFFLYLYRSFADMKTEQMPKIRKSTITYAPHIHINTLLLTEQNVHKNSKVFPKSIKNLYVFIADFILVLTLDLLYFIEWIRSIGNVGYFSKIQLISNWQIDRFITYLST